LNLHEVRSQRSLRFILQVFQFTIVKVDRRTFKRTDCEVQH